MDKSYLENYGQKAFPELETKNLSDLIAMKNHKVQYLSVGTIVTLTTPCS
jgi:hypothetical protein